MEDNISKLLTERRWIYWLDLTHPGQVEGTYRVSIVIENESGHYPTGNKKEMKEPWYWDEATCKEKNRMRGYTEEEVWKISASSMRPLVHRRTR